MAIKDDRSALPEYCHRKGRLSIGLRLIVRIITTNLVFCEGSKRSGPNDLPPGVEEISTAGGALPKRFAWRSGGRKIRQLGTWVLATSRDSTQHVADCSSRFLVLTS